MADVALVALRLLLRDLFAMDEEELCQTISRGVTELEADYMDQAREMLSGTDACQCR